MVKAMTILLNNWFNDLCRTILQQEMADMDFGMEKMNPVNNDVVSVRDDDTGTKE